MTVQKRYDKWKCGKQLSTHYLSDMIWAINDMHFLILSRPISSIIPPKQQLFVSMVFVWNWLWQLDGRFEPEFNWDWLT